MSILGNALWSVAVQKLQKKINNLVELVAQRDKTIEELESENNQLRAQLSQAKEALAVQKNSFKWACNTAGAYVDQAYIAKAELKAFRALTSEMILEFQGQKPARLILEDAGALREEQYRAWLAQELELFEEKIENEVYAKFSDETFQMFLDNPVRAKNNGRLFKAST